MEYKEHYLSNYCRSSIITHDDIRVYFSPSKFGHAFYKNSQNKSGVKDVFSTERAQRMDWIKATLSNPSALMFFGWNKDKKTIWMF